MPKSAKTARIAKNGNKHSSKNTESVVAASKVPAKSMEVAPAGILKRLADNDVSVRTEALHSVTENLKTSLSIEEFELQKLWKGLWFTMWHSDKPATQQALASDLASLVSLVNKRNFWAFVDAFWLIIIREWETLDQHRVNKYLLLVRFMLNSIFARVLSGPKDWASRYSTSMVETGPLNYTGFRYPLSLRLHLVDIYVDELEKVINGQGKPDLEKLKTIFEPVLNQVQKSAFKPVKIRVQTEVLEDDRLLEWGILNKEEEESPLESSDSEWEGFD